MQSSRRLSAAPARCSRAAAVSSTQSRSCTKALSSSAAWLTRSRLPSWPITASWDARSRRSLMERTTAQIRARAAPAAASATIPCVEVSSSTGAQGSAAPRGYRVKTAE